MENRQKGEEQFHEQIAMCECEEKDKKKTTGKYSKRQLT